MSSFLNRLFWRTNQILILLIWIILSYISLYSMSLKNMTGLLLFALLQILQYFLASRRIGRENGYSSGQAVVMTLLFGYSWWMPLYMKRNQSVRVRRR